MIQAKFTRLFTTAILVVITAPIYAQQAPEPAKAPANSNPAAPAQANTSAQDADAAAAAAAIAKAKAAVAAEAKSSSHDDAAINQLAGVLDRQAYEREQLQQRGCGGPCGGK